jgi:hypothetical protein
MGSSATILRRNHYSPSFHGHGAFRPIANGVARQRSAARLAAPGAAQPDDECGGTTALNAAPSTTGAQSYGDAVVLRRKYHADLDGRQRVTLASTVNGAFIDGCTAGFPRPRRGRRRDGSRA